MRPSATAVACLALFFAGCDATLPSTGPSPPDAANPDGVVGATDALGPVPDVDLSVDTPPDATSETQADAVLEPEPRWDSGPDGFDAEVTGSPDIEASGDLGPAETVADTPSDGFSEPEVEPEPEPAGDCAPLVVEHGVTSDGYLGERFSWADAQCNPRSAHLVRNDALDPSGHWGGFLSRYTYQLPTGATRTCDGSSDNHPGWGYTVNHFGGTASSSRNFPGTWETVLEGPHHAIHAFHVVQAIDGHDVDVTIHWHFATGRTDPVWSITYDLSGVPANAVDADTRSPYGDIQWDGGEGALVDGVGWGDHYRFRSLEAPISFTSGYDYSQPNTIPHVIEWSAAADAEMGAVQTQTMDQKDAGGYWAYAEWGKVVPGAMIEDWNWTYQLNQYELPWTAASKRLAWGANYGAVGQQSYPAYGDSHQLEGWPYQSYSVFAVLGTHSGGAVEHRIQQMEAAQSVSLQATGAAQVRLEGPAGIAREDLAPYEPAGWNPVYATWDVELGAPEPFTLTVDAPAPLEGPTFVVHGWTGGLPASISLDGAPLEDGNHVFASLDADQARLWLTLGVPLSGQSALVVVP